MLTLNHLVRRSSTVSAADFRGYWLGKHAEASILLGTALGARKITKCETVHDDPLNIAVQEMYGTASDAYDFVDQYVIGDLVDFKNGLADEGVRDALVSAHGAASEYVDSSRSDFWFSIDVPQIFPREEVVATPDNAYVKIYYVPRRRPELSLDEALLHWNSCHGGLARQYASILPYDKYLQGHRHESAVCDELKDLLGGGFEDEKSIIGQAEAWLERGVFAGLDGPEVGDMSRKLLEDIDLFVTPSSSHIFATKEHIILNRQIVTDAVPSLFGLD